MKPINIHQELNEYIHENRRIISDNVYDKIILGIREKKNVCSRYNIYSVDHLLRQTISVCCSPKWR